MSFVHSQKCLDTQKEYDLRLKTFNEKYPKCCNGCNGYGSVTWYERIDEYGGMDMSESCGCVIEGKCPLCGEQVFTEEDLETDLSCSICGWSEKTNRIVRPPVFEYPCECQDEINWRFNEIF